MFAIPLMWLICLTVVSGASHAPRRLGEANATRPYVLGHLGIESIRAAVACRILQPGCIRLGRIIRIASVR